MDTVATRIYLALLGKLIIISYSQRHSVPRQSLTLADRFCLVVCLDQRSATYGQLQIVDVRRATRITTIYRVGKQRVSAQLVANNLLAAPKYGIANDSTDLLGRCVLYRLYYSQSQCITDTVATRIYFALLGKLIIISYRQRHSVPGQRLTLADSLCFVVRLDNRRTRNLQIQLIDICCV